MIENIIVKLNQFIDEEYAGTNEYYNFIDYIKQSDLNKDKKEYIISTIIKIIEDEDKHFMELQGLIYELEEEEEVEWKRKYL